MIYLELADPVVLRFCGPNPRSLRMEERKRVQSVSARCIRSPADYATATNYSLQEIQFIYLFLFLNLCCIFFIVTLFKSVKGASI